MSVKWVSHGFSFPGTVQSQGLVQESDQEYQRPSPLLLCVWFSIAHGTNCWTAFLSPREKTGVIGHSRPRNSTVYNLSLQNSSPSPETQHRLSFPCSSASWWPVSGLAAQKYFLWDFYLKCTSPPTLFSYHFLKFLIGGLLLYNIVLVSVMCRAALCLVVQLYPTSCEPMTVACQAALSMGILQARALEWVSMPSSTRPSKPKDWLHISRIADELFTDWATRRAQEYWSGYTIPSPGDLPHPGTEPWFPVMQANSLPAEYQGSPLWISYR